MAKLLIQGATKPDRTQGVDSPRRLEIATFVKPENIKQFTLYVEALHRLYARGTDDKASYYQLAGVHGVPYTTWNEARARTDGEGTVKGYCFHNSSAFPPWHRTYSALFEQEIQKLAIEIAQEYNALDADLADEDKWKTAAEKLRQPYWGWDQDSTFIPPKQIIRDQAVEIIQPDGRKVHVPNPFLTYSFRPGEMKPEDWEQVKDEKYRPLFEDRTARRYTRSDLEDNLEARRDTVEHTKKLFRLDTWEKFVKGDNVTLGLEAVHARMHAAMGGHMVQVDTSSYDPIFWLHHAAIDRISQHWLEEKKLWETGTTDLLPFWDTDTTYWKSPGVVAADATFNYSYDRRVSVPVRLPPGTVDRPARLIEKITPTLGSNVTSGASPRLLEGLISGGQLTTVGGGGGGGGGISNTGGGGGGGYGGGSYGKSDTGGYGGGGYYKGGTGGYGGRAYGISDTGGGGGGGNSNSNNTSNNAGGRDFKPPRLAWGSKVEDEFVVQEWSVLIRCKQFEVIGSFSVFLFFGDVPSDTHKWVTDKAYIGVFDVFANDSPDACPKCTENSDVILNGVVDLNGPLIKKSGLKTLEAEDVVPYLTGKLSWGVLRGIDGQKVDLKDFPSLEVTVERTPLTLAVGASYPDKLKTTLYGTITGSKAGGHRSLYANLDKDKDLK